MVKYQYTIETDYEISRILAIIIRALSAYYL